MCPADAIEEEELYGGPAGALLADNGGCACFLVSQLEVAPDGGAGAVEVEDARGVHDEGRPAEKVSSRQCLSILHFTFSFTSKMEETSDISILLIV